MIPQLVEELRSLKVYHGTQSRKRWWGVKPHFISCFIFSREKRKRDRWADRSAQFYIGRVEWRDLAMDQDTLPVPIQGENVEELAYGLLYEPNPNWPPHDLKIPRPRS